MAYLMALTPRTGYQGSHGGCLGLCGFCLMGGLGLGVADEEAGVFASQLQEFADFGGSI